jgi:hypothetical protein
MTEVALRELAAIALLLAGAPATAQDFLEPPVYVVAVWDGQPTAPGLWFTIDGRPPATTERLAVVDRLPEGVTIDARPADLRLSAALAAHLRLRPGAPTLFEIGRIAPPTPGPETVATEADDAATDYADGHARVTELLEQLRSAAADTVAAGYRAAPQAAVVGTSEAASSPAAVAPGVASPARAPSQSGLVALDPRAWP